MTHLIPWPLGGSSSCTDTALPATSRARNGGRLAARRSLGVTLIELMTVLVLIGVLAAIALPRFIDMGQRARIASLQTLAAALQSTTMNVRALCKLDPTCDYGNSAQSVTVGGRAAMVNYGWLDAGDNLGVNQIDAFVTHEGFSAESLYPSATRFRLDGSPDPVNCSVTYFDAYYRGPAAGILISLATGGC